VAHTLGEEVRRRPEGLISIGDKLNNANFHGHTVCMSLILSPDGVGGSVSSRSGRIVRYPENGQSEARGAVHSPGYALSARGISNCNREDLGKRWPT
jgi:hypothetical protein